MPPLLFGEHILSQLTHGTFLLPSADPHQKPDDMDVNLLHILFDSIKQPIGKVGTACRTDLMSVSLPSIDSPCPFQPCTLLHDRSRMCLKAPSFDRPTTVGRPKYLSDNASHDMPIAFFNSSLLSSWQPFPKKMDDFCKFTLCPEHSSYACRISRRAIILLALASKNTMLSSAKRR
jgi:hypothetical protein